MSVDSEQVEVASHSIGEGTEKAKPADALSFPKTEELSGRFNDTLNSAPTKTRERGTRRLQMPTSVEYRLTEVQDALTYNPFDRELEDGTRLRDLMTQEGQANFKRALEESNGRALFVVHPYFLELPNGKHMAASGTEAFNTYKENLTREVKEHQDTGDVFVLFEEAFREDELEDTLARIGVRGQDSEISIVPTKRALAKPKNGVPLNELASELNANGLKKATVIGTQFWEYNGLQEEGTDHYWGCAGYTLERLKETGVETVVGNSVSS